MVLADPQSGQGFSLLNLAILVVIVAVLWPLLRWLRKVATRHRNEVYAREESEQGYTQENDPDLRHDGL